MSAAKSGLGSVLLEHKVLCSYEAIKEFASDCLIYMLLYSLMHNWQSKIHLTILIQCDQNGYNVFSIQKNYSVYCIFYFNINCCTKKCLHFFRALITSEISSMISGELLKSYAYMSNMCKS